MRFRSLEPRPAPARLTKPAPAVSEPIREPLGRIVDNNDPSADRIVQVKEKPTTAAPDCSSALQVQRPPMPPPLDHLDKVAVLTARPASPGRPLSLAMVDRRSEKSPERRTRIVRASLGEKRPERPRG